MNKFVINNNKFKLFLVVSSWGSESFTLKFHAWKNKTQQKLR